MNKNQLKELENHIYRVTERKEEHKIYAYGYLDALNQYNILTTKEYVEISTKVTHWKIN